MNAKWELYKQLELIPDSEPEPRAPEPKLITWLNSLWESLTTSSPKKLEPEIWQRMDQEGNVWWDAYDPVAGQVMYFASEEEIRMWLDQLPYHQRM
ncbi:hypothetical protein K9N68_04500 [Kovacikia minuta CCNUW1]|uniref:hypothetical protein n=1 Tax=Kovacikia minuta TaxID=2931930 RepID=UPI001CCACF2E|nr:hypothetical protein [Kovacikia minuta]UBF27230.1 hypothetical protein K9N68_04500 [Kovacikia minuta CCNUW1]